MRVGILCSRIRVEEKLLFQAFRGRGVEAERIDDEAILLGLPGVPPSRLTEPDSPRTFRTELLGTYDVVLVRSISHSRALYASQMLRAGGIPTVNSPEVIALCGDKLLTSLTLARHGVPTPAVRVAFSPEAALAAMEEMGYPVVLKPLTGSWGRLLAKVNDRDAAEALLEHKQTLGGYLHSIFYIQEYVPKPGRDIRAMVVGDEVIYAIYRESDHWVTNTARGAKASPCPLTPELTDLALAAARAVGGGILAVDLLEDADGRLLVSEVNHTPEFHGAMEVVSVDIAGKMVDYVVRRAQGSGTQTGAEEHG